MLLHELFRRRILAQPLTLIICLLSTAIEISADNLINIPLSHIRFAVWTEDHEKQYSSEEEKEKKYRVWLNNDDLINRHNSQYPVPSYLLGHNHFSDLTVEEYHRVNFLGESSPGIINRHRSDEGTRGAVRGSLGRTTEVPLWHNLWQTIDRRGLQEDKKRDLPASIDWVEKGGVTSVKNQGACGSCWAFSSVGSIEGAHFVATKSGDDNSTDKDKLESLSVQQLLDCDLADHGCLGGIMDNAFAYDEGAEGLCSDKDYPYAMHRHHFHGCSKYKKMCSVVPGTGLDRFVDVHNTTRGLTKAIARQPVSVAIQATGTDFQLYKSGIYDNECGVELDHGVVAVGYGSKEGVDYWLIKNSWGESWGEDGYMKMSVKSANTNHEGQCGIQTMASYPIIRAD